LVLEVNSQIRSVDGAYRQALFGGWLTYAATSVDISNKGRRWYSLQGEVGWTPGAGLFDPTSLLVGEQIGIYETTGGAFAAPNTRNTVITTKRVGTAAIYFGAQYSYRDQFFNCSEAYLSYQFDAGENAGRSGDIKLSRLGPAPAGCTSPYIHLW
jgi:hypothetical protein